MPWLSSFPLPSLGLCSSAACQLAYRSRCRAILQLLDDHTLVRGGVLVIVIFIVILIVVLILLVIVVIAGLRVLLQMPAMRLQVTSKSRLTRSTSACIMGGCMRDKPKRGMCVQISAVLGCNLSATRQTGSGLGQD